MASILPTTGRSNQAVLVYRAFSHVEPQACDRQQPASRMKFSVLKPAPRQPADQIWSRSPGTPQSFSRSVFLAVLINEIGEHHIVGRLHHCQQVEDRRLVGEREPYEADHSVGSLVDEKTWRPTAFRASFEDPEGYCASPELRGRSRRGIRHCQWICAVALHASESSTDLRDQEMHWFAATQAVW